MTQAPSRRPTVSASLRLPHAALAAVGMQDEVRREHERRDIHNFATLLRSTRIGTRRVRLWTGRGALAWRGGGSLEVSATARDRTPGRRIGRRHPAIAGYDGHCRGTTGGVGSDASAAAVVFGGGGGLEVVPGLHTAPVPPVFRLWSAADGRRWSTHLPRLDRVALDSRRPMDPGRVAGGRFRWRAR